MILVAILSLAMLFFLCWAMFNLAVYALPLFVGVTTGMAVYERGAGIPSTIAVALIAAAATLVIAQVLFGTVRSPLLRALVALPFAAAASMAGCHAMSGILSLSALSANWQQAIGIIAGLIVGGVAWSRIGVYRPLESERSVRVPASPSLRGSATNDL